jgi:hypothetical protein
MIPYPRTKLYNPLPFPIFPKNQIPISKNIPLVCRTTLHNNTTRLLQLAQDLRQQRIDNLLDLVLLTLALTLLLVVLLLLLVVRLLLLTRI